MYTMTFLESLQSVALQSLAVVVPALIAFAVAWLRAKTRLLSAEADRVVQAAEFIGERQHLTGAQKLNVALSKSVDGPLSKVKNGRRLELIEKAVEKL